MCYANRCVYSKGDSKPNAANLKDTIGSVSTAQSDEPLGRYNLSYDDAAQSDAPLILFANFSIGASLCAAVTKFRDIATNRNVALRRVRPNKVYTPAGQFKLTACDSKSPFEYFLPALFFLLILFTGCLDNEQVYLGQDLIDEVKSEFVPDRRVNIFDVKSTRTADGILLTGETNLPAAKELLLHKTGKLDFAVTDSIEVLPAAELKGKNYGIIRLSVANLRSAPKHSAELSTQATLGLPLKVWKKEGDWYYVQTPDGYLGWLDADGFTLMNGEDFQAWTQAKKVIVTAEGKKVMRGNTVISDVLPGNILRKGESDRKQTEVIFPDGRSGYLANGDLRDLKKWLTEIEADTTGIFAAARRMNGVPYLWGGTSPKGMDCSGYTKQIFFENGILLPRDASQQVHVGELIEKDTTLSNLLPGDLLFFGKEATAEKKERVSHVAIYLGDGKIIHAAGNVRTQSLRRGDPDFAEDRLLTYLRAKRILGSEGKNGVVKLSEKDFFE